MCSTSWASPAAPIFTGGGWQITPGGNGANTVSVTQDDGDSGVLVLQLFKDYLQPVGQDGDMSSITLIFQQIGPDAQTASKIVINDELVSNHTGVAWTDFHWILGPMGYASFNQDETYPAGGVGFSTSPFISHEWTQTSGDPTLSVFGGTLANNSSFNPGYAGALVIDVNLGADGGSANGIFTLTEIPTIPEPMTMSLLAIGSVYLAMRRKS
jgi:hypothetical protein